MTTNGRDWKFKNRIKKMLADKIIGDSTVYSRNRKRVFANFDKTAVGVFKVKEIVLTDDETPVVAKTSQRNILKSEKERNRTDTKVLNDDDIKATISQKQNVQKKRKRIDEKTKNNRKRSVEKKQKTNSKTERQQRKDSSPQRLSDIDDDYNSENYDNGDSFSKFNSKANDSSIFLDKTMKFGEPMIIEGSPKIAPKFPIYNSPVLNFRRTSVSSIVRGNILSNIFSHAENSGSGVLKNAAMITADSIADNLETKQADESVKNYEESSNERVENSENYSDISFISNDEKSDWNSDSIPTTNDSAAESAAIGDSSIKPEFFSLQNKVIAIMSPSCKFYFNGKLRVKVLAGRVEIYGYVFGKSETTVVPAEIYSPRGSSLISIETTVHESSCVGEIYSSLIDEGINKGVATDVQNRLNELPAGWAVLILENLENTLTKYLDNYYPLKLFPRGEDTANYHNRHPKKAEKLLQAMFHYDDLGKQLKKDNYREMNILQKLSNPSNSSSNYQRILIAGGKGVGKSTTLRYFVNNLLPTRKEIAVIDFDPGQPEFTPPGCISINLIDKPLTGPNYTHLKTPFHQIFIGDVDVARCVPRYVEAARKLVAYFNESHRLKGLTVLINTMGFCTGIGWDLMVYIIKLVHPSTIVQISSERSKNNFGHMLSSEVVNDQTPTRFTDVEGENSAWDVPCDHELHVVPSLAEGKGKFGDFWEMEPRQIRDISLLAYLSGIPQDDEDDDKFLFSPLPRINDVIPYSIPMSKVTLSLTRTIVPASHILATMNGNVIALCGIDAPDEVPDSDTAFEFYPKTLLRAPLSTCYGFGILRGVDMSKGNVYINTPLSINDLEHVNCFVGSIPLPMSLISPNSRNVPYIGEGVDLPTSRDPRRGYFRMRQRNV